MDSLSNSHLDLWFWASKVATDTLESPKCRLWMHSVNGESQKRKCLSVNDMVCCLFRRGCKVRVFHFVGIAAELLPCKFSLYSGGRLMWMFMVLPCWLCWKGKVIEPLNGNGYYINSRTLIIVFPSFSMAGHGLSFIDIAKQTYHFCVLSALACLPFCTFLRNHVWIIFCRFS